MAGRDVSNTNLGKLEALYDIVDVLSGTSGEGEQKTAFDELLIAELTPVIQLQFPYNINTDLLSITTSVSGDVTQSNTKAVIETGASSSSSASIQSKKVLKYNPGQGSLVRFTALFTAGVNGSSQLIGVGDDQDGFFVGCDDTTFGILRRQNGVDTWTYQTNWNGDKADNSGTLPVIDFTKGNVFQIRYQWLGYGAIKFYIENPSNGKLILVHTIPYANAYTIASIYNPTLPLFVKAENTTNDTNIKIETSSLAGFVEGKLETKSSSLVKAKGNLKAAITTETNLITIRNKSTYQSKTNRVRVKPIFISLANEGTKTVKYRYLLNATIGGTPSFNSIDVNNSVIEYDIAGTTITDEGSELFTVDLAKSDSDRITLPFDIPLNPGDSLTITAESSSSTDAEASVTWEELF
jgi:hypothetical protein